jgi:hypothetical protein
VLEELPVVEGCGLLGEALRPLMGRGFLFLAANMALRDALNSASSLDEPLEEDIAWPSLVVVELWPTPKISPPFNFSSCAAMHRLSASVACSISSSCATSRTRDSFSALSFCSNLSARLAVL